MERLERWQEDQRAELEQRLHQRKTRADGGQGELIQEALRLMMFQVT